MEREAEPTSIKREPLERVIPLDQVRSLRVVDLFRLIDSTLRAQLGVRRLEDTREEDWNKRLIIRLGKRLYATTLDEISRYVVENGQIDNGKIDRRKAMELLRKAPDYQNIRRAMAQSNDKPAVVQPNEEPKEVAVHVKQKKMKTSKKLRNNYTVQNRFEYVMGLAKTGSIKSRIDNILVGGVILAEWSDLIMLRGSDRTTPGLWMNSYQEVWKESYTALSGHFANVKDRILIKTIEDSAANLEKAYEYHLAKYNKDSRVNGKTV